MLILLFRSNGIQGATYIFTQSSWVGGGTTNNAQHPGNQSDWNEYQSKDEIVSAGSEIKLQESFGLKTQTSDTDFNSGTNSNAIIFGEGIDAGLVLDSQEYRLPVLISNASGADLTDFQVSLNINTQELISQGNMRSDGGDIRFYDTDGISPLPYWIESGINSVATKIWIKLPLIPVGGTTVYFNYGNLSLESQSNINDVFIREISNARAIFSMDEASGTAVNDMSGNNYNGTTSSSIVPGKYGNARSFNYSPVTFATKINELEGNVNYTVSGWFKTTDYYEEIVSQRDSTGNYEIRFNINNEGFPCIMTYSGGYSNVCGSTSVKDGQWHHYAAVKYDTTGTLYIDGVAVSSGALKNVLNTSSFEIGGNPHPFNGQIDEVMIFSRNLSPDEIADLYSRGYATLNYPGKILLRKTSSSEPEISFGTSVSSYFSSGSFTSNIIDVGQKSSFSTLVFNATTPVNTTLTVDVRAGNTMVPDESWTSWQTGIVNGGGIPSLNGNRYVQYRANLSTSDNAISPTLNDMSFNYYFYDIVGTENIYFTNESDFIQENEAAGTDFLNSGVKLSGTYSNLVNYNFELGTMQEWTASASWGISGCEGNTEGTYCAWIGDNPVGVLKYSSILDIPQNASYLKIRRRANGNEKTWSRLRKASDNSVVWETNMYGGYTTNNMYDETYDISSARGQAVYLEFEDAKASGMGQLGIDYVRITDASGNIVPISDNKQTVAYTTDQHFYVTTNATSQLSTTQWNGIEKVSLNQDIPDLTSIRYLVSFDNRNTWKYWDGSSWIATELSNVATVGMEGDIIQNLGFSQWNASGGFTVETDTLDFAASFYSSDGDSSPFLDRITVDYIKDYSRLRSSAYNTGDLNNVLAKLQWVENLSAETEILFRIRTSSDGTNWTDWIGPDGTSTSYFTDNNGNEAMPALVMDSNNDQWIQYEINLSSRNTAYTPILESVDVMYVVNASPEIQNISASQGSDGLIAVDYEVRDADTSTGATQENVNVSLQYCKSNCSTQGSETWVDAISLTGDVGAGVSVDEVNWTEHQLKWNIKQDYANQYLTDLKIRVKVNDGEGANNITYGNIIVPIVDTKDPILGVIPATVDASSIPAVAHLMLTDDSSLQMKVSLNSDLAGSSWEDYAATKNIALAENPDVVYVQFKDGFNNFSEIISATTPEQPGAMMIQDTSNLYDGLSEFRLFIAWKTIIAPVAGFEAYHIYRSENQTDWTHIETINNRLTNYYGDNSVEGDVNYYYRVVSVDTENNVSYSSSVVSGVANGIKDAGEGGGGSGEQSPVISDVNIDNITANSVQINWTTDVLSSSIVGFSVQPAHFENEIGSGTMVTSHSVVLNGLTPNTQYYFQAKSANASNALAVDTNGGNGYTFITSAGDNTAPSISDIVVAGTTSSTATITWNTDEAATSFIEYSKTNGFSTGAQYGDGNMVTNHSIIVPSLEQGVTYYFKIHSKDAANNEAISAQDQFVTLTSEDVTPPQISNLSSTPSFNSATITWTTDEDATSYVEYGQTVSYGRIYGDNNAVKNHTVQLPYDLSSEQAYHFRVRSSDGLYNEAVSDDNTFTTTVNPADSTAPIIANINIGTPTRDSVTVTWNTDEASNSYVGYSSDGGNTFSEQGFSVLSTFHSVTLSGLTPGTVYLLRISSADASGNKATDNNSGSYYQRATAPGPVPPVISSLSSLNLDEHRTTVSWNTDLAATSFVEYGLNTDYGAVFGKLDDNTAHSVTLEGLLPGTTYHFRVRSTDEVENVSGDYTFTTINLPDSFGPEISAISSTNITKDSAKITWMTDENSNSLVNYGETVDYSMIAGNRNESINIHSVDLDELKPETTYHYQISSTDNLNNISYSADQTLTTIADTSDPEIFDLEVLSITDNNAVISWKTDKRTSTRVNYGIDHDLLNNYNDQINSDVHVVSLSGLVGGQKYYFKAVSIDEYGNSSETEEQVFTTLSDPELNHDPLGDIGNISNPPAVLTDTKAVINFSTDQRAQCFIEYGTQLGQYNEVPVGEASFNSNHSIHLSGLIYKTQYHYRITCLDNLDTILMSDELSFTTLEKQIGESEVESGENVDRVAPSISNVSVKSISSENVVISWDTNENANSMVRFGTSSIYGKMIGDDDTNSDIAKYTQNHEVSLDRLAPGTKYYFEAMSLDAQGNIGKSSQNSFTTDGTSIISSIVLESKEIGRATVVWLTQMPTDTYLEYGISTKYGSEIEQSSLAKDHRVELSGLKGGSIYHFRIKGTDSDGNIYTSADSTFEPKSPPKINDLQAVHVSEHSATITFSSDVPIVATVNYQDSKKEKEAQSKGNPNLAKKQQIELNDLESGLTYVYTVTARDENGLETVSEEKTFVTGKDTSAPIIDQVKTESALAQNEKVQSIVSWKTDEPATSAIIYRDGKNGEDKELVFSEVLSQQHVVVLTSFNQGSVYYFRAKSTDASDNVAISSDYALLTPKTKENIVQIIINNFFDIFKWVNK